MLAACLFILNKCCEQGAEVLQEQDGQPEQASGGVQQPPGRVRQEVRGKFQKIRNAAHGNNFQNFIFRLCKILPLNFLFIIACLLYKFGLVYVFLLYYDSLFFINLFDTEIILK